MKREMIIGLTIALMLLAVPLPGRGSARTGGTHASPAARIPILLDTDIGDEVDDAFALALALQCPELELCGITTTQGDAFTRALIVCRLLHQVGRGEIPVAAGAAPKEPPAHEGMMQYGLRPAFRKRPVKESAVDFLYARLKARPGELTLVAIGPLTNIAELLAKHPDCKPWVKRLVVMGGALRVGYKGRPPAEPEWNIKTDIPAAKAVFAAGVPLTVIPLDATVALQLDEAAQRRVFGHCFLNRQVEALYQLGDRPTVTLFDPAAVAACVTEEHFRMEELRLAVDDKGLTRAVEGKPNARVATSVRQAEFLKWFTERLTAAPADLPPPRPSTNVSAPVARGGMPNRVHVIEDYETDIERRWWLCGRPETKNVPPGSSRACRAVLTNDFDDRMGDPKAMYRAVIFNPVPGPPLGKNTRLSFRCWLRGTGSLRVQIYSLTNNYHRHLTLTDLPQGKWQALTVDLTRARRPDGSGGPLTEGERIDDIQFYADPSAELLIDDIVLYDAAPPGEKRPFPRRPIFTGWFDTGRQGKEWPGTFEMVPKEKPLTGKAARSVPHPEQEAAWIRLHLRGPRPVGAAAQLRFAYRLTGAEGLRVALVNPAAKEERAVEVKGLKQGEWAEATLDFRGLKKGDRVEEIHFLTPKGAVLLVDDVLLYEPGKEKE